MTFNNQQEPKETGNAWPASVAAVEPAWTGVQEIVGQAARATASLVTKVGQPGVLGGGIS